jgi:hypothetical protein
MTPAERTDTAVAVLVRTSLAVWGVDAEVKVSAGALAVVSGTEVITIARAPSELPFRWIITHAGRERAASSVTGLLRVLRLALEPGYRPGRARIATLPPPPEAP